MLFSIYSTWDNLHPCSIAHKTDCKIGCNTPIAYKISTHLEDVNSAGNMTTPYQGSYGTPHPPPLVKL